LQKNIIKKLASIIAKPDNENTNLKQCRTCMQWKPLERYLEDMQAWVSRSRHMNKNLQKNKRETIQKP